MKNTTFQIEFFHGTEGVWKPVRCYKNLETLEDAKAFKQAQIELCGGCVDFHIVEVAA